MEKLLNKLLEMMGVGMEVVKDFDGEVAFIELPLGKISADTYEGGYWGDVELLETDAVLRFACGDVWGEDEFRFGEGTVNLNYAPGNKGLAYTGELEDIVTARIKDLYNLDSDGSEQGMQGDDYLSLDVYSDYEEGNKLLDVYAA